MSKKIKEGYLRVTVEQIYDTEEGFQASRGARSHRAGRVEQIYDTEEGFQGQLF